LQPFRAEGGRKGWRMLDAGSSPSASPYATNILRSLPSAHESTITTGFARKPPHRDAPAETRNSFSPPVCLQTSGLRGFSTELVNADLKRIFRPTTFASRAVSSMREPPRRGDCLLARSRIVRSASATALAAGTRCSSHGSTRGIATVPRQSLRGILGPALKRLVARPTGSSRGACKRRKTSAA